MSRVRFRLDGRPKGKQRPRFTVTKRGVQAYTTAETRRYEREVGMAAKVAGARVLEGPVGVVIDVWANGRHPDLDNASKAILDGLNGVAYHDDSQVAELHVILHRGTPERVEVEVYQMTEEVS